MKNDVIAIRLTDSWITNAQIIALLKADLAKFGIEVVENAKISIHTQRAIPREEMLQANYPVFDFAKEDIAKGIAKELLCGDLIRFSRSEDRHLIYITGSLDVVNGKSNREGRRLRNGTAC